MDSANNAGQTRQTNTSTASQVTENNNKSPSEPELIQQWTVANEHAHSNGTAEADDGPLSTPTRRTISTETAVDGAANRTTNNSAGGEDATFHNFRARFNHHGRRSRRPLPTELFARRSEWHQHRHIQRTVVNEHNNGTAEADDGPLSTPTRRTISTETAIDSAANRTTNNSAGGEDAAFHNFRVRFQELLWILLILSLAWHWLLTTLRLFRPIHLGTAPSEAECRMIEQCTICYGEFTSPTKLKCGHIFCSQCIRTWVVEYVRITCPYCRTVVIKEDTNYRNGDSMFPVLV